MRINRRDYVNSASNLDLELSLKNCNFERRENSNSKNPAESIDVLLGTALPKMQNSMALALVEMFG